MRSFEAMEKSVWNLKSKKVIDKVLADRAKVLMKNNEK